MTITGIQVDTATPVLAMTGSIVDEVTGLNQEGFRVMVKNLSIGKAVTTVTADETEGYHLTVVDTETARAAQIGDILEISAQSANARIGVEPLRHTVTRDDVKRSRIQFSALVAYEIPTATQLLLNYPNPFNPETWIPYRLSKDALVTLSIYDMSGRMVRRIELGHQIAAVYERREKAAYWDGKNDLGERVSSGVYFYTLTAGDFTATRKMVILK